MSIAQQLEEAVTESAPYAISKDVSRSERFGRILHKFHLFGNWISPEHAKKTWGVEKRELEHLAKTDHLRLIKSGKHKGWYELTDKGAEFIRRSRQKKEDLDLEEARGRVMKDVKGKPINRRKQYVFRHKAKKMYIGPNHSPWKPPTGSGWVKDSDDAGLYDGDNLRDMNFDWQAEYEAVPVEG